MTKAAEVVRFIESKLKVPTGPKAGTAMRMVPYMKAGIRALCRRDTNIVCMSLARGNAKSTWAAAVAVAELFGVFKDQQRRDVVLVASKRDQAEIVWTYALDLIRSMSGEDQARVKVRYAPRLEIELDGEHKIRALAADGPGSLGLSPTLAILDERASWPEPKGSRMESVLLTAQPKRDGMVLIVSTSAESDQHPFSQWLDNESEGVFRLDYRAPPQSQPDDSKALAAANPGSRYGVGPSIKSLQASARRAMQRGGAALTAFRNLHLNERIADSSLEPVVTVDEWTAVETADLPPREGEVVIGLDSGGSASMSAASYYWPQTGRLEAHGWFPSRPGLLDRGQKGAVGRRYLDMQAEGSLSVIGDATVPLGPWVGEVVARIEGHRIAAVCLDMFKQAEIGDGLRAADVRARVVLRRFGPFDGGEDLERFRRAVWDRSIRIAPSLLMRSALADAVCRRDGQLNPCLDKGRSLGRIDAVVASVLAVGEGSRMLGRPATRARLAWG